MNVEPSQTLQSFVFDERELGWFKHENFQEASAILGFGVSGTLGVEYDDDVPDDFVENAWREVVRHAWREGGDGQRLSGASNAFQHIAEMRRSQALWKKWEQAERAWTKTSLPTMI
jgi:ubiquitin carboxyl-terminal hydrolase 25/28